MYLTGLPHKLKDLEIERNSKQAEIEILRKEMDRFKEEAENLVREKRRLEENLQKQIQSKAEETPRENKAEVDAMRKEWDEQREDYRCICYQSK